MAPVDEPADARQRSQPRIIPITPNNHRVQRTHQTPETTRSDGEQHQAMYDRYLHQRAAHQRLVAQRLMAQRLKAQRKITLRLARIADEKMSEFFDFDSYERDRLEGLRRAGMDDPWDHSRKIPSLVFEFHAPAAHQSQDHLSATVDNSSIRGADAFSEPNNLNLTVAPSAIQQVDNLPTMQELVNLPHSGTNPALDSQSQAV